MWSESLWDLIEMSAIALVFGMGSLVGCVWLAAVNRRLQAGPQRMRELMRGRSSSQIFRFLIEQLRSTAIGLDRCARSPGYQKLGLLIGCLAGVGVLAWLPLWPTAGRNLTGGSGDGTVLDGELFVLWCVVCLIGVCRILGSAPRDRSCVVWVIVHSWVLCLAFLEISQTARSSSVLDLVSFQASSGLWLGMTQPIAALCCITSLLALTSLEHSPRVSSMPDRPLLNVSEAIAMLHTVAASYVIVLILLGGWHVWGVHWNRPDSAAGLAVVAGLALHVKVALVTWMMIRIRNRWGSVRPVAVRGRVPFSDACCRVLPAVALGGLLLTSVLSHWPLLAKQDLLRATIGWLFLTVVLGGLAAGRGSSRKELTL